MQTGWKYVFKRLTLFVMLFLLGLVFFALGLMLGYGIIGDGDNVWNILLPAKWRELIGKFIGN